MEDPNIFFPKKTKTKKTLKASLIFNYLTFSFYGTEWFHCFLAQSNAFLVLKNLVLRDFSVQLPDGFLMHREINFSRDHKWSKPQMVETEMIFEMREQPSNNQFEPHLCVNKTSQRVKCLNKLLMHCFVC